MATIEQEKPDEPVGKQAEETAEEPVTEVVEEQPEEATEETVEEQPEEQAPDEEPAEDVAEEDAVEVAEIAKEVAVEEPVTFSEVAAKGGDFLKALRRLGTRPVKEAIGRGADTVIDALDDLAGDRKKPR